MLMAVAKNTKQITRRRNGPLRQTICSPRRQVTWGLALPRRAGSRTNAMAGNVSTGMSTSTARATP